MKLWGGDRQVTKGTHTRNNVGYRLTMWVRGQKGGGNAKVGHKGWGIKWAMQRSNNCSSNVATWGEVGNKGAAGMCSKRLKMRCGAGM